MENRVQQVQAVGQSIWYDNIRRGLLTSGELERLVREGGITGVTSNPAIFEKALAGSDDYDAAIAADVAKGVGTAQALYERFAIEDIQSAADVLLSVYRSCDGRDGFVSLEVSPYLAHDTEGTVQEAHRLWKAIGRENVMIKVPATPAGIPAIRRLIADGINVNVTLLFAVQAYEAVAEAYLAGLEDRAARGEELGRIASVASFFVSRIDSAADRKLAEALDATRASERRTRLKGLVGRIAIANARLAYARFRELVNSARWQSLAARGARVQRVLWASTGVKNPKYPKTLYVDALIGPDTVNTVPEETYRAFLESGTARPVLVEEGEPAVADARERIATLEELGISLQEITEQLLAAGVQAFADAFDKLLAAVERKRQTLLGGALARQSAALGDAEKEVNDTLERWRAQGAVRRLWNGDATLWTGGDESRWLGWLHIVQGQKEYSDELRRVVEDVRGAGFRHVLLLGMGGSSLCPEVLRETFGVIEGFPELRVLDSTVPAQVRRLEQEIDAAGTLFVVSSKSGGTTETNVLERYFMERVREAVGPEAAGGHFLAITDPGTALHRMAKQDRFRHILHGVPSIGGRYSALSNFGLVPAGLMGLPVEELLDRAEIMVHSCASCVPPASNPGVCLGVALGVLGRRGRDKLTFLTSPALANLGAWLEQLIAESTGKHGKGLVPVDGERPGSPAVYGDDRIFVSIRSAAEEGTELDAATDALEKAGSPVLRFVLEEPLDLGQEFFRWEIATAVAGSLLGIHPFDQPDVEAAKVATRELTAAYEQGRDLPQETPVAVDGELQLFADAKTLAALRPAAHDRTVEGLLAAHLARIQPGDYFALNAFLERSPAHDAELQALRHAVRDARRVATTLGYGPRFLHSTGQLHKGGPNRGVFLQITAEDAEDLSIPGQRTTFGVLKQAQARGDFQVLCERERRVVRVHLGTDVRRALQALRERVERALSA